MIHTIGYGNRKWGEFLALLHRYDITVLVDIRTSPFSRFSSAFRRSILENQLKEAGIGYVFLGQELGGKPKDLSLYSNGKLNYDLVEAMPTYQNQILKLLEWEREGKSICLMCSEQNPNSCHRKTLVGQSLVKLKRTIIHIDENGNAQHTEKDGRLF